MKLGHFAALCCLVFALLGAGFSYWDMQDGYYSTKLLFLPILTGLMSVALLLFPGGGTTFQQAARPDSAHTFEEWKAGTPPLHRRAWLLTAGLAIYLSLWAQKWLAGEAFFTVSEQLGLLLVAGLLWLFLRKQLRQPW